DRGSRASRPSDRVLEHAGSCRATSFRVELDAGEHAALDGGHDATVVVDLGDGGAAVRPGCVAVGEVDVGSVEAVEQLGRPEDDECVPAHVRHTARVEAPYRSVEQTQPATAFLALVEEELHADADAEDGAMGGCARTERIGEPVALQTVG